MSPPWTATGVCLFHFKVWLKGTLGKRHEITCSCHKTVLFPFILFFTFSLGLSLAVLFFPLREGQVDIAHVPESKLILYT